MNVYEISYQAALDGEYRENVSHFDPWARYFDVRGASVKRQYGDSDLELSSDHLQNIVNLIYSGRKHGIDEIELALDHDVAKQEIIGHFYAVSMLPEVIAKLEQQNEQLVLVTSFEFGFGTAFVKAPAPNLEKPGERDVTKLTQADFGTLTDQEINDIMDAAEADIEEEKKQTLYERNPWEFGVDCLVEDLKTNSRRKVELPQWIIEKYELSEDDADCSKGLGDALSGLAEIFGWHGEKLPK